MSKKIAKKKQRKSQVIHKSKGQNIQIHIDLSKKKVVGKQSSASSRSETGSASHKQPTINLPPPVYGLAPQTQNDNSLMNALNLLISQNSRYEQSVKNEPKKQNIFTQAKEAIHSPTLGEKINKTVGLTEPPLEQLYGTQLETPLGKIEEFSENPQLEEEYNKSMESIFSYNNPTTLEDIMKSGKKVSFSSPEEESSSFSESPSLASRLFPSVEEDFSSSSSPTRRSTFPFQFKAHNLNLSQMKISELQDLAKDKGIDIYKPDSHNTQGKGKGYKPTKNKQQLIEELSRL